MKYRFKLLLLLLITPLLCIGVSFAVPIGFSDTTYTINSFSNGTLSNSNSAIQGINSDIPFCVSFYNGTANDSDYTSNFSVRACGYNIYHPNQQQCGLPMTHNIYFSVGTDSRIVCFDPTLWEVSMSDFVMNSISLEASFGNYSLTSVDYNLYNFDNSSNDCSEVEGDLSTCKSLYNALSGQYQSCQSNYNTLSGSYNTCLDRVNTLNGQVYTLSGDLSSCQSDLSSCTNGCDVMVNQCQENLSGCTTNLDSMTNYADSLSEQLNQCLANSPESCEGTGCDEISSGINVLFSFFWERDDQMFSLPIANNVFLPKGYRAYIDSGVVAITSYDKQSYDIDDSSFDEINKSFYSLIYGFIFLSAVALFCYYLKKFISKSFIPKENKG